MGAEDALSRPAILTQVVNSLVSSNVMARIQSAEILIFFIHYDADRSNRAGLRIALEALESLEQRINVAITNVKGKVGKFDTWLQQWLMIIDGRGRMGSMVGFSKDLQGANSDTPVHYSVSRVRAMRNTD
jgi:cytokinesis protein